MKTRDQLEFLENLRGGDVEIPTLKFSHSTLPNDILICRYYKPLELNGMTFTPTNFNVEKPSFSEKLNDSKLNLQLDLVSTDLAKAVSAITKTGENLKVEYSTFSLNSGEQIFGPLQFVADGFSMQDRKMGITCSYHAFKDTVFPKRIIDKNQYPGLCFV